MYSQCSQRGATAREGRRERREAEEGGGGGGMEARERWRSSVVASVSEVYSLSHTY